MTKGKERIILGIDPGTLVMGYGIISVNGSKLSLISAGVLKINKEDAHYDRLNAIFKFVVQLIERHHPDELAIEEPFFGKNVQSMLKLGRAQGVAMAAALHRQIPVFGYSPRLIKQSITGSGSASKEQVSKMLQRLLAFKQTPKFLDATDAVGVALCHYFQNSNDITALAPLPKTKNKSKGNITLYKGWDAFVNDNPGRLKK